MSIHVKNLTAGFINKNSNIKILNNIDFTIAPGKTLALLGESGCGKSFTALCIMQLLPMNAFVSQHAEIIFDQTNLLTLSELTMRQFRGKRIGMIFQEPMTSLNPVLTIGQQISEVLYHHFKMDKKACAKRVLELLDLVKIPDPKQRINEYPHQLSGGMKQRVMIAIALACEPEILIADEPTTALDVTIQAQILLLLKELQLAKKMSILLITHDLGVVKEMADEVAVMYAGEIVELAECETFFKQPLHPYSKKLFASLPSIKKREQKLAALAGSVPKLDFHYSLCRFKSRCQNKIAVCEIEAPPLFNQLNHQVRCHLMNVENIPEQPAETIAGCFFVEENVKQNQILLNVENLYLHFPIYKGLLRKKVNALKAVDGVSLAIKRGKTLALVGESGCGKSTVGRSILRLLQPTSGSLSFDGKDYTHLSATQMRKLRQHIQIIFQDPYSSLNPKMLVKDILAEGMIALGIENNATKREQKIDQLLHDVGLPLEAKYRYPHEFSGGQRQRICIARALAVKPALIICDEPTSALDVSVQAQIINLLKSLQQQYNVSLLFITHNIAAVGYLADHIAVMYLGRIVEQGQALKILTEPKHPYTKALLSAVLEVDQPRLPMELIKGELPSPINPPTGCHFHPRCKYVMPKCQQSYPPTVKSSDGIAVNCFLYE